MAEIKKKYDVIIVGTGVAGLNCALHIPKDKSVLIICKDKFEASDSYLAQGGISMLIGEEDYVDYFEDTMRAGHYENDPVAVECMIRSSQEVIDELIAIGVNFERNESGGLAYTREGGHSSPRICYHADSTGREITSTLMNAVEAMGNVQVEQFVTMLDIIEDGNQCYGIVVQDGVNGQVKNILADYTVLATGGLGGAFANSTNYRVVTGDAIAICLNHGIAVDNINYIQVHPTTLYSKKRGRRFLISESVRGEGAHLLDKNFNRFTDELKPRDVVKDAVYAQMKKDGTNFVWLDMRPIAREEIEGHFPDIVKRCREEGYDVFNECIPVVPAVHYFMGGIRSDLNGRTTLPRLYAVGETCCNGVHGKNRLASNSLLESLLFAARAGKDIASDYQRIDMDEAWAAVQMIDADKYKAPKKLLNKYKAIVQKAVAQANKTKENDAND